VSAVLGRLFNHFLFLPNSGPLPVGRVIPDRRQAAFGSCLVDDGGDISAGRGVLSCCKVVRSRFLLLTKLHMEGPPVWRDRIYAGSNLSPFPPKVLSDLSPASRIRSRKVASFRNFLSRLPSAPILLATGSLWPKRKLLSPPHSIHSFSPGSL